MLNYKKKIIMKNKIKQEEICVNINHNKQNYMINHNKQNYMKILNENVL